MENFHGDNKLAPIVLFTYNRLSETVRTVESLQKNFLSAQSDLFIFSDGPKDKKGKEKVEKVRKYLKTIKDFKSVNIYESNQNLGLANSIIGGVSKIIEEYGKVIVLEDDLVTSPNFLDFMNQALYFYQNESKIHSISGYTLDLPSLEGYSKDYYVGLRGSSLGWGTWHNKWQNIDWEVNGYSKFSKNYIEKYRFFKIGSDMPGMLKRQMQGKIDSWAIRWCYHQFKNELVTIFASTSKVNHIGDGIDATHAQGSIKFNTPLDVGSQRYFSFDQDPIKNRKILGEFRGKFSIKTRGLHKIKRFLNL